MDAHIKEVFKMPSDYTFTQLLLEKDALRLGTKLQTESQKEDKR